MQFLSQPVGNSAADLEPLVAASAGLSPELPTPSLGLFMAEDTGFAIPAATFGGLDARNRVVVVGDEAKLPMQLRSAARLSQFLPVPASSRQESAVVLFVPERPDRPVDSGQLAEATVDLGADHVFLLPWVDLDRQAARREAFLRRAEDVGVPVSVLPTRGLPLAGVARKITELSRNARSDNVRRPFYVATAGWRGSPRGSHTGVSVVPRAANPPGAAR
ncbi:MAG TPA: hypothetical protein VHU91_10870 [Mycobacteriales bacterium]|jgi:hypothetical protein|nr:hypothetical protein [Mycobacteriales bacterium]